MYKNLKSIVLIFALFIGVFYTADAEGTTPDTTAQKAEAAVGHEAKAGHGEEEPLDVKKFILGHLADNYVWHITKIGEKDYFIPLPVIVHSVHSGWHTFWSSEFHHSPVFEGLTIPTEGKYEGKIVEILPDGTQYRPFDISITKVVFTMLMNSILLIWLILFMVRRYKKVGYIPQKGMVGFMEMFIMNINDELIKPCIGKDYKKFSPYLLTVFFYIFLSNLMGLIPLFPGGVSITGNIAITFTLALITFIITTAVGTKEYWREILWPDVPIFLKVPLPLMPAIEIIGVFSKPFALMVRLFGNMLAGHSILLGLATLIFVTVKLGPVMHGSMTVVSVLLSIFINLLEVLVAFIQAYVFTLLSSVFIGLAKVEPHHAHPKEEGEHK